MDAARFVPFIAAFLLIAPVLWAGRSSTVGGLLYVFGCWVILIGAAAILARRLVRVRESDAAGEDEG